MYPLSPLGHHSAEHTSSFCTQAASAGRIQNMCSDRKKKIQCTHGYQANYIIELGSHDFVYYGSKQSHEIFMQWNIKMELKCQKENRIYREKLKETWDHYLEKMQLVNGLDIYEIPTKEWTSVSDYLMTRRVVLQTTCSSTKCEHLLTV